MTVLRWLALAFLGASFPLEAASDRPQVMVTEIDQAPAPGQFFTDPCWQQPGVAVISLQAPSNKIFSSPAEKTEVRLIWSKDFLFLRFDCQDREIVHLPGKETSLSQRDLYYFKADSVEVFLDPVGDSRMYMEFELSPDNGVFDAIYFCTTNPVSGPDFILNADVVNRDLFSLPEWNLAGLQTAARIWPKAEGRGWSVIVAFPAKGLLQRWGKTQFEENMKLKANLVRFDYFPDAMAHPEITNWAPVLEGCAHVSPAGMGTLVLAPKL